MSQPSGGTETRARRRAPRAGVGIDAEHERRPGAVAPAVDGHRGAEHRGDAEGVDRAARIADRAARELDRAPGRVARERVRDLHRLPGDLDQVPRRECLDRLPDRGGQARDGLRDERGDRHGAARLDEAAPDGAQDRIGPLARAASPARQQLGGQQLRGGPDPGGHRPSFARTAIPASWPRSRAGRGYNGNDMREYRYRVDAEGRVFHDGSEVLDPSTLRFFVRAMQRTPDGRWLVVCQGERNWFEA